MKDKGSNHMKIALGTLKNQGEDLGAFLEPRVGVKPSVSGDTVEIDEEGIRKGVKPRDVKTYIKRFMFMKGVRKNYRVFVNGKELTIQEIELGEKEKEEKEKEEKESKAEQAPKEEVEEKKSEATPETKEEAKTEKPKKSASKKPRKKDSED
jgi:sRNA-binding protein